MKDEMAFLRYRRDVVLAWPETPRKAVFLRAIDTRTEILARLGKLIANAKQARVNSRGAGPESEHALAA